MINRLSAIRNWVIKRVSMGYVVGNGISDAVKACVIAEENGWTSTLCPWHFYNSSAETIGSNYITALNTIIKENISCYLSIKVWALNYDYQILKEILGIAKSGNVRVHFDSLDLESATPTLNIFEKSLLIHSNLSYTLPGRWRRSIEDAKRIIELGVPVRVVKGESADVNYPTKDLRDGFLNLIYFLAGRAVHVDVATHDTFLAEKSLKHLKNSDTPCNLELLYGLPIRAASIANTLGLPIRIYIPYGNSFIPYGLSKITKRPIILAWMIRDILMGDRFRLSNLTRYRINIESNTTSTVTK